MQAQQYGVIARLLHWLVAGLILTQFALANLAEGLEGTEGAGVLSAQLALWANHKSVGMLVLMLAVLRIGWRFGAGAPALPGSTAPWQRPLAAAAHWLLYGLIIALPLSGWVLSSAAAYSVSFFNLFAFPDLVGVDAAIEETATWVHHLLVRVLVLVACVHVVAALLHGLYYRDGVAARMFSWPWLAGALFLGLAMIATLGVQRLPEDRPQLVEGETAAASPVADLPTPQENPDLTGLPLWQVVPADSFIEFEGQQAGAAFAGRWERFDARIAFDPDHLDEASAVVTVFTDSNATGDAERDGIMRGAEWFDVAAYPTAEFATTAFAPTAEGFAAEATLRMRNVALPLRFDFVLSRSGERTVLEGEARIDRLAWGLGAGEWKDPTWVGQDVKVTVRIEALVPTP